MESINQTQNQNWNHNKIEIYVQKKGIDSNGENNSCQMATNKVHLMNFVWITMETHFRIKVNQIRFELFEEIFVKNILKDNTSTSGTWTMLATYSCTILFFFIFFFYQFVCYIYFSVVWKCILLTFEIEYSQ